MTRQLEKYTEFAGRKPTDLANGEIALDLAEARMFLKNGSMYANETWVPDNVEFNEWTPGLIELDDALNEAASIALRDLETFTEGQYCFRRTNDVSAPADTDGFVKIVEVLELYSGGVWFEIERYEPKHLTYSIERVDNGDARYKVTAPLGTEMKWTEDGEGWSSMSVNDSSWRDLKMGYNVVMKELIPGSIDQLLIDDDGSGGGEIKGKIVISGGELLVLSDLCHDLRAATSIDIRDLNTEHVTDMRQMFKWCDSVTEIDCSRMNTDKVTSMQSMFVDCAKLQFVDLSSFNFDNVTDMSTMFDGCKELTCVTNLNTLNATTKVNMFNDCDSLVQPDSATQAELTSVDGSDWINPKICEATP